VRLLGELCARREAGTVHFDRVIIETTGLADPAPMVQTFFVDDEIVKHYLLDAVVTVVDAEHAPAQLDEQPEAQAQVGFADRILLSKTDLVSSEEAHALEQRLKRMNPRAPIRAVHFGLAPIDELLDIRGFNLNAILDIDPDFLSHAEAEHRDEVTSFAFHAARPFDASRLEDFLGAIIHVYGANLMRYKGVLSVAGVDRRIVLQGVHMMMGTDEGAAWKKGELRHSKLVFIGRDMPKDVILDGLEQSLTAPRRKLFAIKGVPA
jgi:G3E family GTPase